MTKHIRPLLYTGALAIACTGWWQQAHKAMRLEIRIAQTERTLNQMDLRITSLALAILAADDR